MSKVIKSFSLEIETVQKLEEYCSASDNWDKTISRSKVVNDSIRWFLTGDVAELVHNNEQLQERFAAAMKKQHNQNPRAQRSWWRRLLGV